MQKAIQQHAISIGIFGILTLLLILLTSSSLMAACAPGNLCDPLFPGGEGGDIRVVIGRVIKAILGISGVVALLMFVWGGFLWLTSAGEIDKVKKGKQTLTWAVIGLVVIFTAYILVTALIGMLTEGAFTS